MKQKANKHCTQNTILQQCDINNAFINDPQQRIYTVPRLE
jgi:hypothetical protein